MRTRPQPFLSLKIPSLADGKLCVSAIEKNIPTARAWDGLHFRTCRLRRCRLMPPWCSDTGNWNVQRIARMAALRSSSNGFHKAGALCTTTPARLRTISDRLWNHSLPGPSVFSFASSVTLEPSKKLLMNVVESGIAENDDDVL